jgi:hypothetical protein
MELQSMQMMERLYGGEEESPDDDGRRSELLEERLLNIDAARDKQGEGSSRGYMISTGLSRR